MKKSGLLTLIGLSVSLFAMSEEPVLGDALVPKGEEKPVVTRLSDSVNQTDANEYVPVISADGKTLLFCGQYRTNGIGGEDIFISHWTEEGWSEAEPIRELCTKDGNEAPLALSADGTKMILFINGKLFTSAKGSDGWQTPQQMSDKINISTWQADAMITSDGKALFFAAKKKGEYENKMSINISVSLLDDNGEWGDPIDLGPTINTLGEDRSPVLHPDMRTLYFSTDGHGLSGDLDVFKSTRLREDSWTEWSEPVSLGNDINTAGPDCWYKISTDGALAYFAKVGPDGNYDMYSISLPQHLRPTPVATISGTLTDPQGKPVVTVLRWEDLDTHEQVGQSQTDPTDGSFFIVLPEGKNYGYYIDDEELFPVSSNIDLRETNEVVHIENNITVTTIEQMIKDEIPMPLNNLFFATNEWSLQPASINELERVVSILFDQPYKVEIGGHTDNVGSAASNQRLSEMRAKAVKDWLVENGIEEDRLSVKGYGLTRPVTTNATEEGRSKNRRVEIKFVK